MIDELISYIPESSYSDKKMLKLYTGLSKNGVVISNGDGESTATPDQSPLIVKAETPGNKNHKAIVTRLRDDDGFYKVQSAHVIPFNKKGSVSPLTLSSVDIEDSFVSTGYDRFARFGEKQSCDMFVDCIDDLTGIFPSSFLDILPRGSVMRAYDGYSYRSLCYYIETFLEASPGVYFGSESNTGGLLGFPLDGKTSFQLVKQGTDAVFSISEGTRITSGLYRNDKSGMLKKSASATDWESDASLDLVTMWNNYLESIESDSSGNDGFEIEIYNGKKGWCGFWIDLSLLENVIQNHLIENFEQYIVGADPSVIDPSHWTKTAGTVFSVANIGGSNVGVSSHVAFGNYTEYFFDVAPTSFPFTISMDAGTSGAAGICQLNINGSDGISTRVFRFTGGAGLDVANIVVAGFVCVPGSMYSISLIFLDKRHFDFIIEGVFYNNSGVHYTVPGLHLGYAVSLRFLSVAGGGASAYYDNIYASWLVSSGQTSWLEVSETRDFLDNASAKIYFNEDEIYNEGAILYRNIDFKRLHRVTLAWDYTGATPVNTFRLDDLDQKEFTWDDGGSALVNGFAINALRIAANYCPVCVHGFCQSGDYFPFVHAESNKQNYLPFNLDLLEKVTGILGPNRRDPEGFKNLRATQPMSVDFSQYALGNIVGQGSWTANAGDDWNGTTILHNVVECCDTDAFFALKALQPYGKEGFESYVIGDRPKDVNGWNNWNANGNGDFTIVAGRKAFFNKNVAVAWTSYPRCNFPTPCSAAGSFTFEVNFPALPTGAKILIRTLNMAFSINGMYLQFRENGWIESYSNATQIPVVVYAPNTTYTITVVVLSQTQYDLIINGITYTNGGLHYTNFSGGSTWPETIYLSVDGAGCIGSYYLDNITTSWNCPGPDVLTTAPVGKGRVLKIYDNNAGLNLDFYKKIFTTKAPNGRWSFKIFPVAAAAGNDISMILAENAVGRCHLNIELNGGIVYLVNRAGAYINCGTVNLGQVNYIDLEWSITDRNVDTFSDCRVIVNGVYSAWISTWFAIAVGVDYLYYSTSAADVGIECYYSDFVFTTTGLAFDSTLTKPQISYPDGDFLDVRYLQRARYPVDQPYVRLMNASGNGTEQRLVTLNDTSAMDHRVDEVNVYIPTTQTNYRVLGAGGVNAQWTDGLIPNHWLPLALTHQIHAKYPRLFTHDTFYNRYQFCYSAMTALITEYSRIIVANLNYENCAEMEFTPSVHPFIHPNNIAFYRDCANALPEKFSNSPQRMRKPVLVPQEFFADYPIDGNIVTLAAAWTDGGGASATEYLKCVMDEGKKVGKWNENLGAGTYTATLTFPMPSPTIPGMYSISFRVKVGTTQFFISFGDAAAAGRTVLQFDTANYSISNANGPVLIGNNLWGAVDEYSRYYDYTIWFIGVDKFYLIVDGVIYDNAGAYYTNTGNYTGAITRVNIYGAAASLSNAKIEYIIPNWKLYPDIDADDFIIHPQYLGHAKPVEIVSLEDKWGFRDYGKYTAISNAHPTRSWVSFFVTAPYGMDEGTGEIILYDTAGNEMLYIQVTPMNATDYSVHPKLMKYASTSAGGLTTIDGTWNGWLPVTVEFNNDSRKGNIYFHGQLVAGDITLGAGALVGFGKVVFLSGLKTVAPVAGVWRQEDFQTYAEAAAPGAPWTLVAGGGTSFTARYLDGDARGYFNDVDAAATLSAILTFPIPSPGSPGVATPYSVKWSQQIMHLANNGFTILISATVAGNGQLYLQIRANGALWNFTGGAWVNTGLFVPFPTLEHEVIVQFTTNALYNIYIDGVLQNAVPLAVQTAFVAAITYIRYYTVANNDDAQVYLDDIDVSWSDCVQTAGVHHIHGSLFIDGITFGGYDNSNKDFSVQTKNAFMLPHRDYINPHHSTFHNNLNGPLVDISPLPPYNAVPDATYNLVSWNTGLYWDFYSLHTAGMYGATVRNWYAWNFPYIFGGRFDEPNKDVKSIARLYHDVSPTDKKTSGKWEFVMHGNARQIYDRKDDFTAYLDGQNINGLNGWTIYEGAATSLMINGYEGKKVLDFYDAAGADYCMATNTLPTPRNKVSYLHFKVENSNNNKQFLMQMIDGAARTSGYVRFQTTGMIQINQLGVITDIVAYAANTEYDVLIKVDFVIGKYWVWVNNILYGGMVGYDFASAGANAVNTFRFLTDSGETTYHVYLWDVQFYDEPGSVDVTIDFDHLHTSALVDIPTPPMDICEKWQLQFVPAVVGTKAIIQGDGIAEDFQQYAAGVVPTTGWTIAGATATAWIKTKDVSGNIVGEFSDADGVSSLSGIFVFPTASTNPIGLRTWVSFDATPISITVNDVHTDVRNTGGATTYMRVKFVVAGNISITTGAGDVVLTTWTSGTKYHVQVIVVSASTFDVIINNVLYDNAGAHYTCVANWSTSDIGQIQFVNNAAGGLWNVYVDNIAASWLRAPTTIANFDKAKALHKYTVEWDTGFIWTSIDDKLVDQRRYGGRVPFYLDRFKAHVCSGYGLHEIYAVMFGAQCDNEAAYEPNCLDLIPGGTMEQEGYTGILNTRNKGTYALLNSKDAWTLEKTAFWKTMMLDSGGLPVLGNFDDVQNDLVELEKKAVGHRSNVYNNANKV